MTIISEKLKAKILLSSEGVTIDVKTLNEDIYEEWYIVKKTKKYITIAVTRYKWDNLEKEWYEIYGYLFDFQIEAQPQKKVNKSK